MARIADLVNLAVGGGQGDAEERRIHFAQFGNVTRYCAREMVPGFCVHLQKSGANEGNLIVALFDFIGLRLGHEVPNFLIYEDCVLNSLRCGARVEILARYLFARQTLPSIYASTLRTMGKHRFSLFRTAQGVARGIF
jgi:hypothetical protein